MKRRPLEGTGVFVLQIDKPKEIAAYVLVVAAVVFGFWQDSLDDQRLTDASREACEATNTVRENQASGLQDQIKQTEETLEDDLGSLEPFRRQIVEGQEARKRRLMNLRESLADAPREPDRPFAIDCDVAYPD